MSDLTIREMRPDEADAVGALTLAAYDASGGRFEGEYRAWLADPSRRVPLADAVLVATDGEGCLLGTVTFVLPGDGEFEHPPGEGDAGFRILAVSPEAQGRGVGEALVEACLRRAREAGARRIVIASMEWMTRAHALYRRLGFLRRPDLDVRFPGGTGWVFALDLTDDAADHFDPPGPARTDDPPWFEDAWGLAPGGSRPPLCGE